MIQEREQEGRRWGRKTIARETGVPTQTTVLAQLDSHAPSSELPENSPRTSPKETKTFRRRKRRASFVPNSDNYKEFTSSRERVRVHEDYPVTILEKRISRKLLVHV